MACEAKTAGTARFRLFQQEASYTYLERSYLLYSVYIRSPELQQSLKASNVDFNARVNGRNKRKLRGKIYGASKKQVASLEAGKPTMLKTCLLPSLGLRSSLAPATVSFYPRASSCRGVCQRSTCSGARIRKISPHVNHVKNLPFLRSRTLDLRVQKQLYLRNGAGYPYQILNEHGESIDKAESSEISKKIFADLYYIFACTVTYVGCWALHNIKKH